MKLDILIDVDGVVSNLHDYIIGELALNYNFNLKPYDFSRIGSSKILPNDKRDFIIGILNKAGFAKKLAVLPGSQEAILNLKNMGHRIVWVSGKWHTSPSWANDRDWWLKEMFDASSSDIIYTDQRWRLNGDVFIDDSSDKLKKWSIYNPKKKAILFKQPWNRYITGLTVVDSWLDLQALIGRGVYKNANSDQDGARPGDKIE